MWITVSACIWQLVEMQTVIATLYSFSTGGYLNALYKFDSTMDCSY